MPPTKVLICDDHTLFSEGIKAILRGESSLEVVGEARDGRQAVEKVKELHPDVVLMDIAMPDLSGFEATRRVHEVDPAVKVLMLTMHDEEELVARCLEAGASGYIIKDAPGGPSFQAPGDEFLFVMHGEHEYLHRRIDFVDPASRLEAAEVGHGDIHQHDIRMQLF